MLPTVLGGTRHDLVKTHIIEGTDTCGIHMESMEKEKKNVTVIVQPSHLPTNSHELGGCEA